MRVTDSGALGAGCPVAPQHKNAKVSRVSWTGSQTGRAMTRNLLRIRPPFADRINRISSGPA
jgi:hypothetical protein